MKKMVIIYLFSIFIISLLYSQDLNEKENQLKQLKSKISKQDKIIKQAEKKKKEKKNNLYSLARKKEITGKKINSLRKSENLVINKLNTTQSQLKQTNLKLESLNSLCEKEFKSLCQTHYESELYPEKKIESKLLAALIINTADEIYNIEGKKYNLEKEKKKREKKFENLQWSRIVATKKKKKYIKSITKLNSEIFTLEKKKKSAKALKEKYEKDAAALDELISKLRSDIISEHFSFKFSTPKLIWPIKGTIIRGYGEQKTDSYNVSLKNNGIDIGTTEGSNVVAVESGIVAFAELYGAAGKLVIIDHKNGFNSLYSHNSSLLVSKGDKVNKNQI